MENVVSLEQFKTKKEEEKEAYKSIEEILASSKNIETIMMELTAFINEGHDLAISDPIHFEGISYVLMQMYPEIRYIKPQMIITPSGASMYLLQRVYKDDSNPVIIANGDSINIAYVNEMIKLGRMEIKGDVVMRKATGFPKDDKIKEKDSPQM